MGLAELSQFVPEVSSLCRDAPQPVTREAVLRSVQAFCKDAHVWREDGGSLDLVAGVREYDIDHLPGTYVIAFEVLRNGQRYYHFIRTGHDSLLLDAAPSIAQPQGLQVTTWLMPTEDGEEVPDVLWHECREAVIAGAVSILKAQKGRPWYDPDGSLYCRDLFHTGLAKAKLRVLREFSDYQLQARGRRIV